MYRNSLNLSPVASFITEKESFPRDIDPQGFSRHPRRQSNTKDLTRFSFPGFPDTAHTLLSLVYAYLASLEEL